MKHRFFLSISLVLCAGLVACTKDYEPAPLGPDGHQKLSADQVFWNVVGKIVGMDQMTYCIPFTNENHPGFEKVNY